MKLLIVMRLMNVKVKDKLIPLLASDQVDEAILIRHAPVGVESPKLRQIIHDSGIVDELPRQRRLAQIKNVWLCFYQGLHYARRENPHAILAVNLFPYGVIAWLVSRLTGKKAIISLIGTDFNLRVHTPGLGWLLRSILRKSDRVTIFGEEARARLIGYGVSPERVFTLPNTADTELYKPNPHISPDVDLIYTGPLRPLKRIDLVLHTLRRIHETRPSTTLLIVGDGTERAGLEALAQSLGIAHAVTFYGWTDHVVEHLRRARLFVFLSDYEGLPMAMVEAMCSGLPVVVTNVGAINTVVKDGENGYLLSSPADPSFAAERILRLLEDDIHYDQVRQAALKVRTTHGYPQTTQGWSEILSGLTE